MLTSRVTDPLHYCSVGIPPSDLLEDVAKTWQEAGVDVNAAFSAAAAVSDEWTYAEAPAHAEVTSNVAARFKAKYAEKRRIPLRMKSLHQILDPQPVTASVLHGLLGWIDRADRAHQAGGAKPPIEREDGEKLFPHGPWWLTELERRKPPTQQSQDMDDAKLDEEDLTLNPDEAGVGSSTSDESLDEGSEASLPAGPVPKRRRLGHHTAPLVRHLRATALPGARGIKRRRLRGKQPMPASHVAMAAPVVTTDHAPSVAATHVPSTAVSSPAALPSLLLRGLRRVAQTVASSAPVAPQLPT